MHNPVGMLKLPSIFFNGAKMRKTTFSFEPGAKVNTLKRPLLPLFSPKYCIVDIWLEVSLVRW